MSFHAMALPTKDRVYGTVAPSCLHFNPIRRQAQDHRIVQSIYLSSIYLFLVYQPKPKTVASHGLEYKYIILVYRFRVSTALQDTWS